MQIVAGGSPSRTYVMHCNVNKHVTDVHWNHSIRAQIECSSNVQKTNASTSELLASILARESCLEMAWHTSSQRPTSSGRCLVKCHCHHVPPSSCTNLELVQIVVMSAPLSSIRCTMSARPQCASSAYCNCQLGCKVSAHWRIVWDLQAQLQSLGSI